MTRPKTKAITDGLPTITPHIVVPGAARAAERDQQSSGAQQRSRVPLRRSWRPGMPALVVGSSRYERREARKDSPAQAGLCSSGGPW
jgi:hypothetical protein